MQPTLTFDPVRNYKKAQKAASIQKLLNWFVFFLAFPALNVLGNSVTFYIFIGILFKVGNFWSGKFRGKILFFSFLSIVFLSAILAPYSKLERYPGVDSTALILIQYVYWILTAIFFIVYHKSINYYLLSKWILYGTIASIIAFYLLKFNIGLSVINITFDFQRNAFCFNLLCTIPICFYYLKENNKSGNILFWLLFFLFAVLFTNGRSGAIIVLIQILLIANIHYPKFNSVLKFSSILFLCLFFLLQTTNIQIYMDKLANQVDDINPRIASLLRQEGEGNLAQDKSWLERKLLIEKGFEIAKEYPVFGIGPDNFTSFDATLDAITQFDYFANIPKNYYNRRSSHNSYMMVLSEFGYTGLIILALIIVLPLFHLLKIFTFSQLELQHLPLLSLFGISIHFYVISSLTGTMPWMVFGLAWASTAITPKNK